MQTGIHDSELLAFIDSTGSIDSESGPSKDAESWISPCKDLSSFAVDEVQDYSELRSRVYKDEDSLLEELLPSDSNVHPSSTQEVSFCSADGDRDRVSQLEMCDGERV